VGKLLFVRAPLSGALEERGEALVCLAHVGVEVLAIALTMNVARSLDLDGHGNKAPVTYATLGNDMLGKMPNSRRSFLRLDAHLSL
jgi:hypothetical protein